jgi:hypothetical protein
VEGRRQRLDTVSSPSSEAISIMLSGGKIGSISQRVKKLKILQSFAAL